jgi:hypothetical protein
MKILVNVIFEEDKNEDTDNEKREEDIVGKNILL